MFGELKDVPDPQELENGSLMNSVNEEINVSRKDIREIQTLLKGNQPSVLGLRWKPAIVRY